MKILVTGCAGYIGSTAVAMLREAGHSVNVLDDLSNGHADSLPPDVKLVKGSLLSDDDLSTAIQVLNDIGGVEVISVIPVV
ncbi:MAG: NAD-dependent epimerase/dehydratase family protein [Candidatus Nanopelagicaceae bacterium]